jgi:hypothetical protein
VSVIRIEIALLNNSALVHSPDSGGNMQANITTDDEETDRSFDNGPAGSLGLDQASIGGDHDAGHPRAHFYRATLIERIVGFMDKYN